ncbi:AMP-binding protein, partial [Ruminiclostridium cellobioparum]|uniref:AMP-binding protein n=1 Tax=Ruminiclostridium cellobioparum TaxID=29355 RepID=UPI00048A23DE
MNRIQENLLLNSEEFLQQKKYWLDRLSGYYPSSNLFMKTRAADYGNKRPIKVKFSYPDELSESLIMLSKQSDLSLYLILLMALKCLIYKYTGSNDIIVCSPVYSDYCSEYTVNDVVLIRDEIREEKTLRECILDTGKSALKAYENQDYPFKNILNIFDDFQEMNPFRNINVMCMLNNIHRQIDIENTDYGLVFAFDRNGRTVELELSCTDGIFNERMLNQLVSALENVLNNIITDVNITIHDAAVISKEERNYIIHQFNSSSHEYPEECCIYQLFEEQMERTPDNIAIEAGGRYLTYRELNEKANRLARVLREKGVKRDSIVAIMADQSVEFVVAVLGVLKAGGAYLPIDMEYPEERIRYMLEDSGTVIVLKDSEAITALDREQGTL